MANTIEAAHEVLKDSPVYQRSTDVQQDKMAEDYVRDLDARDADLEEMRSREDRR